MVYGLSGSQTGEEQGGPAAVCLGQRRDARRDPRGAFPARPALAQHQGTQRNPLGLPGHHPPCDAGARSPGRGRSRAGPRHLHQGPVRPHRPAHPPGSAAAARGVAGGLLPRPTARGHAPRGPRGGQRPADPPVRAEAADRLPGLFVDQPAARGRRRVSSGVPRRHPDAGGGGQLPRRAGGGRGQHQPDPDRADAPAPHGPYPRRIRRRGR